MKGVGFPNLEDAYRFVSKHSDLDVACGRINPKEPVLIMQEEPEQVVRDEFTRTFPILLHNKDYQIQHGILFCGTLVIWQHGGEVWVRKERWTWNGKDVMTVTAYDAVKAVLNG